jgi:mannose-6-phosphate isomerase-like protein (cupin superfamily)
MAQFINSPSIIKAAGTKEKIIREFFGHVNSKTTEVSIAHMKSPEGWEEPGQCPEFNEYTVVLKGKLRINTKREEFDVSEGQGIMTFKNEWVKYSTPFKGGAEYIAVCLPAFSPAIVHRDDTNYY